MMAKALDKSQGDKYGQADFLHDTWLAALVAINISLLVNIVSGLTGLLLEFVPLALVILSNLALLYYVKLKADTLSGIERQIRQEHKQLMREPTTGDVELSLLREQQVRQDHMTEVGPTRKRVEVLSVTSMIVVFLTVVGVNMYKDSQAQDRIRRFEVGTGDVSNMIDSVKSIQAQIHDKIKQSQLGIQQLSGQADSLVSWDRRDRNVISQVAEEVRALSNRIDRLMETLAPQSEINNTGAGSPVCDSLRLSTRVD